MSSDVTTNTVENGHKDENAEKRKIISASLKELTEMNAPKINIDKVFVLNDKCFVKTIKPASDMLEIPNSNGLVFKKDAPDAPIENKLSEAENKRTDLKHDEKLCLETVENTSKKNSETEIKTIQNLLNSLTNSTDEEPAKEDVSRPSENSNETSTIDPCNSIKKSGGVSEDDQPKSPKKVKKQKKFLYRLKSKNGKILSYTSSVPITLKRPVISLKKMTKEEAEATLKKSSKRDINLDVSAIDNESEKVVEAFPVIRKRGRPRVFPKSASSGATVSPVASVTTPTPVVKTEKNAGKSETMQTSKKFGIQTRKRQLKFLPDGRLLKNKKQKISTPSESSLSDDNNDDTIDLDSDDDYVAPDEFKEVPTKSQAFAKKMAGSVSPVENEMQEKKEQNQESVKKFEPTSEPNKLSKEITKSSQSIVDIKKSIKPNEIQKCADGKKSSAIDPAQLLSSLIGVPVTSDQLTIIRFKPKNLYEKLTPGTAITKKIYTDSKNSTLSKVNEMLKNSALKNFNKPALIPQNTISRPIVTPTFTYSPKILPKPAPIPKLVPIVPKSSPNNIKPQPASAPARPKEDSLQQILSRFDNYTDTRVVKTKEGPKKFLEEKIASEAENSKTVYEIMNDIFDTLPSWNLHVIPESNSFCIAQVSRSRMGIPALKKSIELNSDFFAKVYVHQLHCKRYDGIYDTENKLRKLILDIDALAA